MLIIKLIQNITEREVIINISTTKIAKPINKNKILRKNNSYKSRNERRSWQL